MAYSPHAAGDRERMLAALGIDSVETLFAEIPASVRATGIPLPDGMPEQDLAGHLQDLADRNVAGLVEFVGGV
jgi:glycine dehydrogenase subunit 1